MNIVVYHYQTPRGKDPITDWLSRLSDKAAVATILRHLNRLELGHFGDHKHLRDGCYELRIHRSPGYRVYYGRDGAKLVILLVGGVKRTQTQDIKRALEYWNDYQTHL